MAYVGSVLMYGGIGAAAALVEWGVFYVSVESIGINYIAAGVAGFVVATAVNYLLSRRYGFIARRGGRKGEIARVYFVSGVALGVNLGAMVALVELAAANVMVAKILGTGCGFFLNFAGRQFWVFDSRPRYSLARWLKK